MAGPDRVPHARSRQYHPTQMPQIIVNPRGSSSSSPHSPTKQPPRPQNAWILYRQWALTKLLQEEPELKGVPQAQLSKRLGTMWKEENAEVRGFFEHEANVRKEQHAVEHPNYVFRPVKRSIKEREREERKREKIREKEAAKLEKQRRRAGRRQSLSSSEPESRLGSPFGDDGPSPPLTACPSRGGTPEPLDLHSECTSSTELTMTSIPNGLATKSAFSWSDDRSPSSCIAESPISPTFPSLDNSLSSAKLAFPAAAESFPSPPDSLSPVSPLFPTPDIMPGNSMPSIIIADSFNDLCPNPLDAFEFESEPGIVRKGPSELYFACGQILTLYSCSRI